MIRKRKLEKQIQHIEKWILRTPILQNSFGDTYYVTKALFMDINRGR